MLLKLALRNTLRQKVRSGMTLAAIIFGVTGLILAGGFVQDIFIQLGEAIIHSQTGHLQVFKKDFLEKGTRSPERFLIEQPEKLAAGIAKHPEVDAVMSRLYFSGLLNNGKRDLAIIGEGVEPDKEAKLGSFITIAAGRQLAKADRDGILLGQGVAKTLGLVPGDRVTLVLNAAEGAMNTMDFEVVGVFQSFSKDFDARAVRIPLDAAQELLQTKGANLLVVALHKTEDTDAVHAKLVSELGNQLDVRTWNSLSDFYDKAVQLYDRQFGVLQFIILLMVLLSVANSVNMSVFERQGEFGTMQALGNQSRDIVKMVILESAFLGLTGAVLGVLLGITAALTISAIGIPMPPPPNANLGYTAYIRIVPLTLVTSALVGFVATVLASIVPAYKVTRMQVVDALRQNI
ncbi:ABC transporter permease [Zoogloea oryzae]|uniref:ABC transporter permease n=1 Tax=Zoogloea oryzae TaxID=310767 RepID=A0ABQ6FCB1_9RHOO|nr:ABC transporter permease [Zoogloea oryzae]GLT23248.1 ABC transporter permease [Zoogloea oryzae]